MATEKKHSDSTTHSEARLRAILDTAVEGIIIIDTRCVAHLFNNAAERMFGYKADEVLGRNINMLMPSPEREMHDRYIANYLKTGKAKIIGIGREVRGQRKNGQTFPMTLAVSEITAGGQRQFVGIVRDMTERRRLEEALVMATENERQIIGQELHDTLSQQLTAIALMTRAMEKKFGDLHAEAREEAKCVAELAKDTVNVAKRLAHGLFPTELERNGLAAALEELADNQRMLFKKECRYFGIKERLNLLRPVERNLYRIAQEAVSNAVKHSGARRIEVTLDAEPAELRLSIKDDGCGLPHHQQPGKGMGLAIMRYRASMINGTLTLSSAPRSGTTVSCLLPDWQKATEKPEAL